MEYHNNHSDTYRDGFLEYASQLAVMLGGNARDARKKMQEVYDLEKRLAQIFVPKSELTSPWDVYHKMTLKEFQAMIGPWIDVKRYLQMTFRGHQFSDTEPMIVKTPSYFKNLSAIVEGTDKEVLANYLMWHTIQGFIPFLPDSFLNTKFPLIKLESGVKELSKRWKRCTGFAKSLAGFVASAHYVNQKFSADDKAMVLKTIDEIRQNFITNLETVQWLDDVTRKRLREKAEAVYFSIGYPDWILDPKELDKYYAKLEVKEGNLLENKMASITFYTGRIVDKYGKKPDKKEWDEYPITVNGYYNQIFNMVIMPAGILQEPFFSRYYPTPFLYATIGMVVGHELTHAFDNYGRNYDKHGNLGNQWTPETSKMYASHASCIEKQYGRFSLQGVHLKGKTTLNENIADNGAIRLGYKSYLQNKLAPSLQLPGLNITQDQMFFLGYAQIMCAIYTPEYEIKSITTDEHSHPIFRVKGVFDNMPQFDQAFNCPVKPGAKQTCRVW